MTEAGKEKPSPDLILPRVENNGIGSNKAAADKSIIRESDHANSAPGPARKNLGQNPKHKSNKSRLRLRLNRKEVFFHKTKINTRRGRGRGRGGPRSGALFRARLEMPRYGLGGVGARVKIGSVFSEHGGKPRRSRPGPACALSPPRCGTTAHLAARRGPLTARNMLQNVFREASIQNETSIQNSARDCKFDLGFQRAPEDEKLRFTLKTSRKKQLSADP